LIRWRWRRGVCCDGPPRCVPLRRSREVADLHLRNLAAQRLDQRRHAQRADSGARQAWQQHFWVNIQVAQLDESRAGLAQELHQRRHLILGVNDVGEAEQIDAAINARVTRAPQRLLDMLEGVAKRAIVGVVGFFARRDRADTDAIQPGVVDALERAGIATIGVDVEDAARSARPDAAHRLLDQPRLQERLALAALAKAVDGVLGLLQVRHAERYDLLNFGDEEQAILRRDEVLLILLGDAADAARVAARRDGDGALPAAEEEIAGGRAAIVQRAVGVVRQRAILRLLSQSLAHQSFETAQREVVVNPALRVIGLNGGDVELTAPAGDGGVAEEGQWLGPRRLLIGRQARAHVANRQQRRQRPAVALHLSLASGAQPDGEALRHHREGRAIGQRNQVARRERATVEVNRAQRTPFTHRAIGRAIDDVGRHVVRVAATPVVCHG